MQSGFSICFPAGAEIPRLPDRTRSLTNFLWSRKRSVEDADLRKKAVSLEKELWQRAMAKAGGRCLGKVPDIKNHFRLLKPSCVMHPMQRPLACHNNSIDVTDVDEQLLEDRINKKVISELRKTTYRWTPLKYGMFFFFCFFLLLIFCIVYHFQELSVLINLCCCLGELKIAPKC